MGCFLANHTSLAVDKIRFDDKEVYVKEGHGGKHYKTWPFYKFYQLYVEGYVDIAKKNYEDWYFDQISKYMYTPKNKGGMYKGSLFRLLMQQKNNSRKPNYVVLKCAIQERVEQRFQLLTHIKDNGFVNKKDNNPISAIKRNGLYYLKDGSHRVAALAALGYKEIPMVIVFKTKILYILYRCHQKIIKISKDFEKFKKT